MLHENPTLILVCTVRAPVVGSSAEPCLYHLNGRGGRFDYGTEQTKYISINAYRNAINELNILKRSNVWQVSSTL